MPESDKKETPPLDPDHISSSANLGLIIFFIRLNISYNGKGSSVQSGRLLPRRTLRQQRHQDLLPRGGPVQSRGVQVGIKHFNLT